MAKLKVKPKQIKPLNNNWYNITLKTLHRNSAHRIQIILILFIDQTQHINTSASRLITRLVAGQQIQVEAVHLLCPTQGSRSAQDQAPPDPASGHSNNHTAIFLSHPIYNIILFRTTKDEAYPSTTRSHLFHFYQTESSQEKQAATLR